MMSAYLMASLVPMALNLLLMPVYSLFMEKHDFAIVSYFNSFNSLFFPFILFYLNQYYMREFFYYEEKEKEKLYANMYKIFLFFPFVGALIASLLVCIYMHFFNSNSTITFFPYGLLTFFSIAFTGLYYIEQVELKNRRDANGYLKIVLFYAVSSSIISIVLVVIGGLGALGKIAGTFLASVMIFLFLLLRRWNRIKKFDFQWDVFKNAIVFCLPLVFAAMLTFFANGLDKVLLERTVSVDRLGIYAIGLSIGGTLSVFSSSIGNTFSPDIFEALAKKDLKKMLKYTFFQFAIMSVVVFIFVFLAKFLIVIFTANRYIEATPFARIAAFNALTVMMYSIVSNVIFSYKKTKLILYTKIIGSIVCIGMYVFLIERYKEFGAAIGYVCGNIIFSVIAMTLLVISLKKEKRGF